MIIFTREEVQEILNALECATPPTFSSKLVEEWHKAGDVLRAKLSEPKKEWVGLKQDDWPLPQYEYSADFQIGAQWAADKMKDKNHG